MNVLSSMSFDLGLESIFDRMIISIVYLGAFLILVLIGGRILIAGCQLIRPSVKIFKIKEKSIEKKQLKEKKESDNMTEPKFISISVPSITDLPGSTHSCNLAIAILSINIAP